MNKSRFEKYLERQGIKILNCRYNFDDPFETYMQELTVELPNGERWFLELDGPTPDKERNKMTPLENIAYQQNPWRNRLTSKHITDVGNPFTGLYTKNDIARNLLSRIPEEMLKTETHKIEDLHIDGKPIPLKGKVTIMEGYDDTTTPLWILNEELRMIRQKIRNEEN